MSLYKDASLVMLPSAVKDGKLYSIRPTDGDGDFTFSRGSNLAATRVDVNGLIEKGRENLLLQSNNFNTTWNAVNASVTSGQTGYDGSNDAWLLSKSAAHGNININLTSSSNDVHTFSLYAKANASDWMRMTIGSPRVNVFFNVANGTLGEVSPSAIDTNIESVGNGWYRVSFSTTYAAWVEILPAETMNDTGGTSGSLYIQDAQVEKGLVATDYIETGASTAQAGILEDLPRLDYSGGASCPSLLLESQRTNVIESSEYFNDASTWFKYNLGAGSLPLITDNYATSPQGVQNATRLQLNAGGTGSADRSRLYTSQSTTTGTDYTFSFYAKSNTGDNEYIKPRAASVNYSEITITTEWQRFDVSFTANATGSFEFGFECRGNHTENSTDILIYGAQFETGSYPTSYIPTYGSAVTRSLDNITTAFSSSLTSGGNVSVLFDVDAAYRTGINSTADNLAFIFSNDDRIIFNTGGGSKHRIELNVAGRTEYIYKTMDIYKDERIKVCTIVTDKTYEIYANGSLQFSGTFTGTANWTSADSFNSTLNAGIGVLPLQQMVYFPTALTSSEAIALTTI
jgi:hypothetical protein